MYSDYQLLPQLCPKCTFILLYTTVKLKACKVNYRKKCATFLRGGGGGSPEECPYDVSRGQNRYVTLPLLCSGNHYEKLYQLNLI